MKKMLVNSLVFLFIVVLSMTTVFAMPVKVDESQISNQTVSSSGLYQKSKSTHLYFGSNYIGKIYFLYYYEYVGGHLYIEEIITYYPDYDENLYGREPEMVYS